MCNKCPKCDGVGLLQTTPRKCPACNGAKCASCPVGQSGFAALPFSECDACIGTGTSGDAVVRQVLCLGVTTASPGVVENTRPR